MQIKKSIGILIFKDLYPYFVDENAGLCGMSLLCSQDTSFEPEILLEDYFQDSLYLLGSVKGNKKLKS